MKKLLLFSALLLSFCLLQAQHCGTWRWQVKTLTDNEGLQILSKTPVQTTISSLAQEIAPQHLSTGHNFDGRISGEDNVVSIDALIVKCKLEPDHDYHLVLQDPNSNETIVSEIPDPDCDNLRNFPELQERYRTLRNWIASKINITTSMQEVDPAISVKVQGVAFWDAPHGATGASDQGREIHPITDIVTSEGSVLAFASPQPFHPENPPNKPEEGNINPTDHQEPQNPQPMTTTTPIALLVFILLGAILGMAGQVIRVLVGIKKDKADAVAKGVPFVFNNHEMLFSLLIAVIVGGIAGVLAGVNSMGNLNSIDKSTVFAFIAAGYAGTDLIEGFAVH